jgi:polysaccharide export outer membrane protein
VMTPSITVLQALSQAGGLTVYADGDDIKILRKQNGTETSIPFDYDAVASGRELETNISLRAGDVIIVPSASLF